MSGGWGGGKQGERCGNRYSVCGTLITVNVAEVGGRMFICETDFNHSLRFAIIDFSGLSPHVS